MTILTFRKAKKIILLLALLASFISCEHSKEVVVENPKERTASVVERTIVYSEFSEHTNGKVTLGVFNKDEITCGNNEILVTVENVDPSEIVLTATGGSLTLMDKKSLTYTFSTECKSDKYGIFVSRKKSDGKYIMLARIPLIINNSEK